MTEDHGMDELRKRHGDTQDWLIRHQKDSPEFSRPADETIEAFLNGSADDLQREVILTAIAASADFRKEMASIATGLIALNSAGQASVTGDQLNDPDELQGARETHLESEPAVSKTGGRVFERINGRLWSAFAVAVAALVVIVGIWTLTYNRESFVPVVPSQVSAMELEQFVLDGTRTIDNSTESTSVSATELIAAEREFSRAFVPSNGELQPSRQYPWVRTGPNQKRVVVRLSSSTDKPIVAHIIVPSDQDSAVGGLWILGLPSRRIFQVKTVRDTVDLELTSPSGLDERGGLTIVRPSSDGYRADKVVTFGFGD
jgi:hypothetical protein